MKSPLESNLLVVGTASKGFFEWCIRKLTGSLFNHVMILYVCPFWGGWWAIQVDGHGVRPIPVEKAAKPVTRWCLFESDKNLLQYLPATRPDMDKDYDYAGIIGFFLRIVTWWFTGNKIRNIFHKRGELFCSEFLAKFLRRAEVEDADTLKPSITSPADIVSFCESGHGFTRVSFKDYPSLQLSVSTGKRR